MQLTHTSWLRAGEEEVGKNNQRFSDGGESGSFMWAVLFTSENKQAIKKQYGLAN